MPANFKLSNFCQVFIYISLFACKTFWCILTSVYVKYPGEHYPYPPAHPPLFTPLLGNPQKSFFAASLNIVAELSANWQKSGQRTWPSQISTVHQSLGSGSRYFGRIRLPGYTGRIHVRILDSSELVFANGRIRIRFSLSRRTRIRIRSKKISLKKLNLNSEWKILFK